MKAGFFVEGRLESRSMEQIHAFRQQQLLLGQRLCHSGRSEGKQEERGRDSGSRDARQQIASSPSLLLQSFSMIHPVKPRGESRCCVSRESLSPSSLVKGSTARESDCGSRGLTV